MPPDFLWGWAIAGTEAEGGGLVNQWTEWSDRNAPRLAAEHRRRRHGGGDEGEERRGGMPPARLLAEASTVENYCVGRACEMWSRYPEDFSLARQLGFGAAQISVEWSRLEPEPGAWDQAAMSHYVDMVSSLRQTGQEPFVALWHFGNPLWMEARGGWRWAGAPEAFARFAVRVVEAFGAQVTYYITVVEPKVFSARAHLFGEWPPGERSLRGFFQALRTFTDAHNAAYRAIKDVRPTAQLGASVNDLLSLPAPGPTSGADALLCRAEHAAQDRLFRRRIIDTSDWLGLNYYVQRTVRRGRFIDVGPELSDLGLNVYPEGITTMLLRLRRFDRPVYVTEFGVADSLDRLRLAYIDRTLLAIREACAAGVDVRGAFYWSLLDNYEWDKGYWPRFGLVEVDRSTLDRRPRPSAAALPELLRRHRGLPSGGVNVRHGRHPGHSEQRPTCNR